MNFRHPIPRSGKPIKRSPIKKRPRKKSETLRIYGPPARREFVKSLPCAACGVVGYSENAHLLGNGGMGRKADADTIGPLCRTRMTIIEPRHLKIVIGCHKYFDRERWLFDTTFPDFDPERVAAATEAAWVLEDTETT